ncbi:hypothetical protein RJT34_16718 [Clitoria ternatea]|uniref:Uncharacterized protein n=1 Tax=Clitoria ternatea TaxID=43366 RepID=A0AAN9J7W7_CLITE
MGIYQKMGNHYKQSSSVSLSGVSPLRIRPNNSPFQPPNSTSVLSFVADIKRGKKGAATYLEDSHQLRLLHNRYLQWRFANARVKNVLYIQNAIVELSDNLILFNVGLLHLLKQMTCLNDWAVLERDHIDVVSGAVEDLQASTLRLPVTGRAMVKIERLKVEGMNSESGIFVLEPQPWKSYESNHNVSEIGFRTVEDITSGLTGSKTGFNRPILAFRK